MADKQRVQALGGRRITGTILSWRGSIGWIRPSSPIDHPEAALHRERVFVHNNDLEAGAVGGRLKGASVSFQVYADGNGLGASKCRVAADSMARPQHRSLGVQRTIAKRPPLGRFAARSAGSRRGEEAEQAAALPWVQLGAPGAHGPGGARKGKGGK
eukprot:CAMPEP_0168372034 /NCGR_PEP_ID=MMETSP0228-20121227/8074_1 /TAXON_ID=133427 /ORGANISM="Protoceratium reticulatum, Strain CCCM 535 (=CCMP 1889)" /LENGTH=156 /DNA_ID=CAMNT_0008384931 /DNA_START=129 /DNA_END=596 /DNA_ORIENTATION=-